tara:strand:- start:2761 stop:3066 length:306 start_codon:yes stop_codon:yes gene_type:complete
MPRKTIDHEAVSVITEILKTRSATIKDLATFTGYSTRTITRYLSRIEAEGFELFRGIGKSAPYRLLKIAKSQNDTRENSQNDTQNQDSFSIEQECPMITDT